MAYRVSEEDVIAIMDTALVAEQITPFLEAANSLLNSRYSDAGYTDQHMANLERWGAAHFAAIRDPQIAREKQGQGEWTYHGHSGLGLDHTPYGQQFKILDYLGIWEDIERGGKGYSVEALV